MSTSINTNLDNNKKIIFCLHGKTIKLFLFRSGHFFYLEDNDSVTHGTYSYNSTNTLIEMRTYASEYSVLTVHTDTIISIEFKEKKNNTPEQRFDNIPCEIIYFDDTNYRDHFIEIGEKVLADFYKDKKYFINLPCCAPLTNMNISSDGNVGLCNANFEYIYGKWPNQTLKEMWFSEKRKLAAHNVLENKLDASCVCHNYINKRYVTGSNPLDGYDNAYDILKAKICDIDNNFPINMRFQLGIKCNMKCIMCGEHASSLHREAVGMPKFMSPFEADPEKFLREFKEFIPHLQRIVLTGGESFMQPVYYKVFDLLVQEKWQGSKIYIFSNGSVYNTKIEKFIKFMGKRVQINLSIDSFDRTIYSKIRLGGDYNTMMKNLFKFKSSGCDLRLSITAMKQNAYDMTNTVSFCDTHNIRIGIYPVFTNHSFFNGDTSDNTSFFDWSLDELRRLLEFYSDFDKSYYKDKKLNAVNIENKSSFKKLMKDVGNFISYSDNKRGSDYLIS